MDEGLGSSLDQRLVDEQHLKLLSVLHFVGAGFALLSNNLLAIAVATLPLSACGSPTSCGDPCGGSVAVPIATQSAPIATVSTDAPCDAFSTGGNMVYVSRQGSGTCEVRVSLTNGDTYAFSMQFRASGSGCCGSTAFLVDASAPALVDAGGD